jgi:hypothetical protein
VSYLKCLTDLASTDPAAAAARYHMLPVMLTVEFAPTAWTVGRMLTDTGVQAAWAARRANRPGCVSGEQWRRDHDAAMRELRRVDPTTPLKQHCEVQVVLKALAEIRHGMHEIYKVKRADSGELLYADVVKPEEEEKDGQDLIVAAGMGRIATVERLLAGVEGEGEAGDGGAGRQQYVNQRRELRGSTALFLAAQNGHLPVVMALLGANADPSAAETDTGATPAYIAARQGHVNILALLLEANADPSAAKTTDGATPLFIAAQKAHLDVLALLLETNVDLSAVTTDYGQTCVSLAAELGHIDVIRTLVAAGAQTGTALTSNGATDLWLACCEGHTKVVRYLVSRDGVEINRARSDTAGVNLTPDIPGPGTTPLQIAELEGHAECATILRAAGAA